ALLRRKSDRHRPECCGAGALARVCRHRPIVGPSDAIHRIEVCKSSSQCPGSASRFRIQQESSLSAPSTLRFLRRDLGWSSASSAAIRDLLFSNWALARKVLGSKTCLSFEGARLQPRRGGKQESRALAPEVDGSQFVARRNRLSHHNQPRRGGI